MVFGLIEGIVKFFFNILKSFFGILGTIFGFFMRKIQFLVDILREDQKFENYLKTLKSKKLKAIKLNDEI